MKITKYNFPLLQKTLYAASSEDNVHPTDDFIIPDNQKENAEIAEKVLSKLSVRERNIIADGEIEQREEICSRSKEHSILFNLIEDFYINFGDY